MRDDRDIQRSKPASAPEKGRGPQCGKDRRSATVCPCRHVPTCHGIPAKAFQVSLSASHLARNPRESVPGVLFRLPPGTEIPRKCSRCLFPPSTCHGIPAKVFQVSLPAVHLPRNSRKSVPGVSSRRPPATVFLRKRSRCHFLPPTWHGNPAKVFQVGDFVRCPILPPTCHSVPADVLAVNGSQQAETCTMVRHSGRKKGA